MDLRWKRWSVRAGVTLASCAVAIFAVATAPAQAADGSIDVSPPGSEISLGAAGSPGKIVWLSITATNVVNPKLVVDFSGASGKLSVVGLDSDCTTAGQQVTCPLPDGDLAGVLPLAFLPLSGATDGASGTVKFTVSADNADAHSQTSTVKFTDGVDLVVLSGDSVTARPGDAITVPVQFFNAGNRTADGFLFTLQFPHGVTPTPDSRCEYVAEHDATLARCTISDKSYEPGEVSDEFDFAATVAADGLGEHAIRYSVEALGESLPLPAALQAKAKKGTGTGISIKAAKRTLPGGLKKASEVDANDNFGALLVNLINTFDVAAVGANASGPTGTTVWVQIGLKNNGPGSLDVLTSGGSSVTSFDFQVPPGTSVVAVPNGCFSKADGGDVSPVPLGKDVYTCMTGATLFKDEPYTVKFGLHITEPSGSTKGAVVWAGFSTPDEVPTNDKADVVVTVVTGGDGGNGGGSLPITGTQTALVATGGAVLLTAGALLFLLARRRRVVLVTPKDHGTE